MGPLTSIARLGLDPVILAETFLPRRLIQALSTICGMWTAVSPLLLWIAWPPHIWTALFWSGMVGLVLTGIFTAALMPRHPRARAAADLPENQEGPWSRPRAMGYDKRRRGEDWRGE
jgi:hypothetical protein